MNLGDVGNTAEDRVINCHKFHYEWIDKAILADEANEIENAVSYYIKGLEYTNMCLKEKVTGNSHRQVKAKDIQNKMKSNRQSAIERLEFLLSNKLNSEKDSKNIKKCTSLDMDEMDFSAPTKQLNKSMRLKKVGINDKEKKDKDRKDSYTEDAGMGTRSHSANCLNKIHLGNEGNLAKALKSMKSIQQPHANNYPVKPTVRTPVSRPIPISARARTTSGPPKPKIEDKPIDSSKKVINKENIWKTLKNIDKECVETILNEVLDSKVVKFEDIAGNETAKQCLLETVIYPRLRPELFTGLRSPAKGILLFGPPGNGKTLLAKAVANESQCVFFNISAASLMSKWVGEGEKMVRALFAVAHYVSPSVIFLDEVDSLLSARNSDDKSVSRRMLTQFLQEIDGAATDGEGKVLVMAATNRPDELDDAALRRFQKKIYIKMPEASSRKFLFKKLLTQQNTKLKESDIDKLIELTKGYSSSDLTNLAKTAAMIPIRELSFEQICSVTVDSMRPLKLNDFILALKQIKPSVPPQSLLKYDKWNSQFGDNS